MLVPILLGGLGGIVAGVISATVFANRRHRLIIDAQIQEERAKLASERVEISAAADQRAAETIAAAQERLDRQLAQERQQVAEEAKGIQRQEERLQERDKRLNDLDQKLAERDRKVDGQIASLERREQRLEKREAEQTRREQTIAANEAAAEKSRADAEERLEAIAALSKEDARAELMNQLDHELLEDQGRLIAQRLKETEDQAKTKAMEVIGRAIQRYAGEHTAETTTAKVTLADEEFKGRIIGKEGRNIRSFSQVTGVDLIVDDTPGQIIVSCFDGVRREVARRALEELLADGRIHPARIEEVVAKVQQDLDRQVRQLGEDTAYEVEVSGLHPQLIKLLGKLQYRTSYGQNVLQHTKEVAWLCGALAADIGLDPRLGRRCGLLHDIGKAIDHEQEGSHPELGYEALKRYGEGEIVANAALAHHEGHEVLSVYTTLAAAADAISAARPGARRDNVERYIKRLQQLEDIACGFKGVMKAYAIQAGRELRVIVDGHRLPDQGLPKVARDIAREIEDQVAYPGEVRVTLIRETRQTAVAR